MSKIDKGFAEVQKQIATESYYLEGYDYVEFLELLLDEIEVRLAAAKESYKKEFE